MFTTDQIDIIRKVVDERCKTDTDRLSRAELFLEVQKLTDLSMEQYKFERLVSRLVKDGLLGNYVIKTGRSGGVMRDSFQKVKIQCSDRVILGKVPSDKLRNFIDSIKRDG